ncbi:VOC family protein [Natronorubrum daqingense]|uniref:Catechol 2,3-dioxygenase n=1 Tax=Natronorubrum daqingense TaxID=588898 RepID=A0A1N7G9C0_9EURY|nr:VOC family protein [Natronorubrum daqingense]APX97298.1 glyoxalase [Natronorubrum daqingense]SIS09138.1 catechol 2,3-dioxygenase [Natronorubrum daqingense]
MTSPDLQRPASTRLGRCALTVSDESAVTEFYRKVIGLEVVNRDPAVLGVDGTPLLEIDADPDASPRDEASAGLFHVAIRVPSDAAVATVLARISERWTLSGASDHGVSKALYCRDPEGNGVEVYVDRPESEWPRDDDGSLQIGSWPLDLEELEEATRPTAEVDGPSAAPAETVPPDTTIGHVHLEVSSLEESRAFYADTLGFDVMDTAPSAVFLAAGGYHHHLGINTWNRRSKTRSPDERGLAWFELLVSSSDALEEIRTRLEADGHAIDDRDDGIAVSDPDGTTVRFAVESK